MARKPVVAREKGPKVWYPGLVEKDEEGNDKLAPDGKPAYIYEPWPEGDYVLLKARKNGFVNEQASFQAREVPSWLTADIAKDMSNDEYHKLSWRSDLFTATVLFEMLDFDDPEGPWLLHDRITGAAIDPVPDVRAMMQVFEDWEVIFLKDEINKLGRGIQPEPPTKDPLSGATFLGDGPTGVSGDGEEPGPGGTASEAVVATG